MARAKYALGKAGQDAVSFKCPGCGYKHVLGIEGASPAWGFNGDMDRPTLTPSIHVRQGHYCDGTPEADCFICKRATERGGTSMCLVCHSFVTDIHDDILSALSLNDAALVAVGARVDGLIAEKSANEAVFSDVLPRVTAQGSAIAALDAKIAGALPAKAAPAAVDAQTSATPAVTTETGAAPSALPFGLVPPAA